MRGARSIGRVTALLLAACVAFAQSGAKTTGAKKKPVAVAASRRPTATKVIEKARAHPSSAAASTHARTLAASHDTHDKESERVGSRKVVVTRKLVHGKWVRTTQIVHTEPKPSFQTHPDTDRYQQIQQALTEKGYFKGEANGEWGDDSVAALKQYQTDQKIPNDGKITALSLIGLGLGPNRETAAAKPEPVPPADQPQ